MKEVFEMAALPVIAADAADLPALLQLEQLERNLFRGRSRDDGFPQIFGGQVVAQALMAASQTVDADRAPHSLHAYFLRTGDASKPIVFEVERNRDGNSFTTRNVQAIQDGETILSLMASFHIAEDGFCHRPPMPEVPPAESLLAADVAYQQWIDGPRDTSPGLLRLFAMAHRVGIDIRAVPPDDETRARQHLWLRIAPQLPESPLLHAAMLAYASDFGLLGTAKFPHKGYFGQPDLLTASLDHALWFHQLPRVDQWLLYSMEAPVAFGARAHARGMVFDQRGELLASVMQEGLMRRRQREPSA